MTEHSTQIYGLSISTNVACNSLISIAFQHTKTNEMTSTTKKKIIESNFYLSFWISLYKSRRMETCSNWFHPEINRDVMLSIACMLNENASNSLRKIMKKKIRTSFNCLLLRLTQSIFEHLCVSVKPVPFWKPFSEKVRSVWFFSESLSKSNFHENRLEIFQWFYMIHRKRERENNQMKMLKKR